MAAILRAKDTRIKYVIFNRHIFSSYSRDYRRSWVWGSYSGSNPHTSHAHISLFDTKEACEDTRPWPGIREEAKKVTEDRRFDTLMLHYDPDAKNAEEIREEFKRLGLKFGKAVGREITRKDSWHYWEKL